MRLAIVGSRDFADLAQVRQFVADLPNDTIVISGGAEGVDQTAVKAARARGLTTVEILPDTKTHAPTLAPLVRNSSIVAACDRLVAFWGSTFSTGTLDVVRKAVKADKLQQVFRERPKA